ncbi:MAG: diaminopimelate epimerase [Abditibacteriota bacterium]|nr:diaminopimelate epimerase [Abditibacteriota bacterium]
MKFLKMHGIGNDFIVIENIPETYDTDALGKISRTLCHRNFGIGSDGLIVIMKSPKADFRMRMMNPDGSEAQMCGNGIRVFAKYVYDEGLTDKTYISVDTMAGIKYLDLTVESGRVTLVRVDMGEPILRRSLIPMAGEDSDTVIAQPLDVGGKTLSVTAVSMGNPHCISVWDELDGDTVKTLGPIIENHPMFPERTNVEFIKVISRNEIEMRVWERGAAETMACGTGACASAVACMLNGYTDEKVTVHLRGGDLIIERTPENRIMMTGPAVTVCSGETDVETLKI